MRGQRTLIVTMAVSAVLTALLSVYASWSQPTWWALPALLAAVAISVAHPARFVIGGQQFTFDLCDVFLLVALVVMPGNWITVAYVAGYAIVRLGRLSWLKLTYNLFTRALSAAVGVAVTLLFGGLPGAVVGFLAFFLCMYLLISLAVSQSSGRSLTGVLRETVAFNLLHEAGNVSVGLLGAWLLLHEPFGLLGLVVPVGLLWWSYEQQARRTSEVRLFEELARGQEQMIGASIDRSAQVVVTAATRVFGGAHVELLVRHPEGPVLYTGDANVATDRVRVEADAFGTPQSLQVLAARGVLVGVEDERPFCTVALGDANRPLAILMLRRQPRAVAFGRADQQLAEALARQAESWLSMADLTAQADEARGEAEIYRAATRALGEVGAETGPALVVLRESSDRLARLASRFEGPDPVSQIVDELHSVERAVASLLGAIALAQPASPAASRADSEWTTTGRLEPADRG